MLEWYRQDCDYGDLMTDCENLVGFLGSEMAPCTLPVSLEVPWQRLTVEQAFRQYCSISPEDALRQDRFDLLLVQEVEPHLGRETPTFLYDYPLELASLARPKPHNPELAERFELYIAGVELGNGFSELTDPAQQRLRFEEEYAKMDGQVASSGRMPERFLSDLGKIDRAAGIAMGLDRLLMLFLGADCLDEVVTFAAHDLDS